MAAPEIERAARLVAKRAEAMVIAMLVAGERGEVAIMVDFYGLKPIKRVFDEGKTVKVARGQTTLE